MGAKKRCRKKVKKKEACRRLVNVVQSNKRRKHLSRLCRKLNSGSNPGKSEEDAEVQPHFNRECGDVSNRHKALSLLHNQMVGLEVRFQEDVFRLEERYARDFYAPMQALRRALTERNCTKSPFCEQVLLQHCKSCFPTRCGQFHELQMHVQCLQEEVSQHPGCCDEFWLTAMLHSESILRKRIQPWDTEVLRYLADIRVLPIRVNRATPLACQAASNNDGEMAVGFDLLFDFRPNPFFTNTKLIKRYVIDILPDRHDYVIAPHHDVAILDNLSEEWDADCEDSDDGLSRSRTSRKHCDVDKLLNYNGPQVIAIRGGCIQWRVPGGCSRALVQSSRFSSSASLSTQENCVTTNPSSTLSPTSFTDDACCANQNITSLTPSAKPPSLVPQSSLCTSSDCADISSFPTSCSTQEQCCKNNPPTSTSPSAPSQFSFPSNQSRSRYSGGKSADFRKISDSSEPVRQNISSLLYGSNTSTTNTLIHCESGVTSPDCQVSSSLEWRRNSQESARKSFFDFFDLTWTEKSTEHRHKDILRDYHLGSYIREILIPRAYLLFRRKNIKKPPNDGHGNHLFASRDHDAKKERSSYSNYDDIDDDIPLELSKQALKNIQSCSSIKSEIFRTNREIALKIARCAQVMRDHGSDTSSQCVPSSILATVGSTSTNCDVDDVIIKSTSSGSLDLSNSGKGTSDMAICSGSLPDDVMTPSAASRASVLKARGGGEIRSSPEPESNQGHVADDELGCGSVQSGVSVNRAFERIKYDLKCGVANRLPTAPPQSEPTESSSVPLTSCDEVENTTSLSNGGEEDSGTPRSVTDQSASGITKSLQGKWSWPGTPSSTETDDNVRETLKNFAYPPVKPSSDDDGSSPVNKPYPSSGVLINEDNSDSEAPPPPSVEDSCRQQ